MKIELPTPEETQLEVVIGKDTKKIDLLEFEDLTVTAFQRSKKVGSEDPKVYIDIFIEEAEKEWGLKLSRYAAVEFLEFANDKLIEIKKKLQIDSTPSKSATSKSKSRKTKGTTKSSRQSKKT